MSKYVPPRSRKPTDVSSQEAEKRRQRLLRFSRDLSGKTTDNSQKITNNSTEIQKKPLQPPRYGFVSRGEDSALQSSEDAQREYFEWILRNFECQESKQGDSEPNRSSLPEIGTKSPPKAATSIDSTVTNLRKLREAMLHQKPSEFSVKVHLFSIRVSAPVGHYQTYVPSINYLLACPELLSASEVSEIAILLVLHISHHNIENEKAFRVFEQYLLKLENGNVYEVLVAWASLDYYNWIRLYNSESDHCIHAIMAGGLSKILSHMAECMTKLYFSIPAGELQRFLPENVTHSEYREKYAPLWSEEGANVVIRRRK